MKKRSKVLPVFALMVIMGAMFFSFTAYASDDSGVESVDDAPRVEIAESSPGIENLSVDAVWLEGDTLHVEVTDKRTGVNQELELPLDEYAGNSEYVSVQAVDRSGNKSNTIQFKNPFYTPGAEPEVSASPAQRESGLPNGVKPFTPDGTGTVVDNVTDGDGKEFFSIQTDDGNVFYLIVDRQRETENVYLLNAVTEDDLASLAKDGDGKSESAVPEQTAPTPAPNPPPVTAFAPDAEPDAPPANNNGMNSGTIIFIAIAAAVVGIAGYYFKILRPKKNAAVAEDDYDEGVDPDDDDDDYIDPVEGGDDE